MVITCWKIPLYYSASISVRWMKSLATSAFSILLNASLSPIIVVREARESKSNKSLQIQQKSLMRSTKICKILNRFVRFLREAHSIWMKTELLLFCNYSAPPYGRMFLILFHNALAFFDPFYIFFQTKCFLLMFS